MHGHTGRRPSFELSSNFTWAAGAILASRCKTALLRARASTYGLLKLKVCPWREPATALAKQLRPSL